MQGEFQSVPQDEDSLNSHLDGAIAAKVQNQSKSNSMEIIWTNLQKIISILVVGYFILLMINLATSRESSMSLILQPQKNQFGGDGRLDLNRPNQGLQSIIPAQPKQLLLPSINQNSKRDEVTNMHSQFIKPSTVKQQQRLKQIAQSPQNSQQRESTGVIKDSNFELIQTEKQAISFEQPLIYYASMVKQLLSEKEKVYNIKKEAKINEIFTDIDDRHHKAVHTLNLEEREAIINLFFRKEHRNGNIEQLLKQNYDFQSQRSKMDTSYLRNLKEDYLFPTEQQSFICVILNTRNNAFNDQISRALNSIYNQQYRDYQLLIADTSSTDGTVDKIQNYLKKNEKLRQRTKLLEFDTGSVAQTVLLAAQNCRQSSLVLLLDGNTQLIGKEVFNMIDFHYQQHRPSVIYSSQYSLDVSANALHLSPATDYDESQKFMPLYREVHHRYGKLFVAKKEAIKRISENYIKSNEVFFQYSGIDSIALSLLQLSCGKIRTIRKPLALSIYDSSIEDEEETNRIHELKLIKMKKSLDLC